MSTMNLFERDAVEVFEDDKNVNIILFHGYGADANDLAPLARMIPTKHKCNWFFPQGPLDIPLGGYGVGKAWWPIPIDRYQAAGADLDVSIEVPKNMEKLRSEFKKWLFMKDFAPERTVIGGFSQGGMLALDLFYSFPQHFKALVLLSSNLINKIHLKSLPTELIQGKTAFISHGNSDKVLPISGAKVLETFMQQSGLKTKSTYFSGGHEIPAMVLNQLGSFFDQSIDLKT